MTAGGSLRVLILEDRADDAELLVHELERAGFEPDWTRAETEQEYLDGLERHPAIILADYALPQFDALAALRLLAERGQDVPVIVVSGAMSEEACVECLRHGAVDYLLKDRLTRLGPAVGHALAQHTLREAKRRAEQLSREHEEWFRIAFDHAPIGMAVAGPDGRLLEVNAALCAITGYPPDELRGRTLSALTLPDDLPVDQDMADRLLAGESTVQEREIRLRHAGGRVIWTLRSGSLVRRSEGGQPRLIYQVRDISDRKRAEAALAEQLDTLERQWELLDLAHDAVLVRDPASRITYWNREAEAMYGWSRAEVVGRNSQDVFRTAYPVSREAVERALAEVGRWDGELVHTRRDGVRLTVHSRQAMQRGPAGEPVAVIEINSDITARKQAEAELRRQADELARSNAQLQRLDEAKNAFVASVSHELRTPLTSITGYTELLASGEAGRLDPPERRMVEVIDRNSRRLLALIDDLLTLSRMDSGVFSLAAEPVPVADLVERVHRAVRPAVTGAGLELRLDVAADPGVVQGDAKELERVLTNVLSNAVKFSPDGGTITVGVRRAGGEAVFTVADAGMGIPEEEQDKLFSRFFRSSTASGQHIQGTGLGLAVAKGIVDQHGGWIRVTSAAGAGTTVTVGLPLWVPARAPASTLAARGAR